MDVPERILEIASLLPYSSTYFSVSVDDFPYPDCLVDAMLQQPAMGPWEDENGNIQGSVRMDQVDNTYWISAKEGTQQSDIDAAVAAYPDIVTEKHPPIE